MTSTTDISPLGPIDPSSVSDAENQKSAPWIVRKLVGVRTSLFGLSYRRAAIDRSENTVLICD